MSRFHNDTGSDEPPPPTSGIVPVHGLTQLRGIELSNMNLEVLGSFLKDLAPDSLPNVTEITLGTVRAQF